MKSMDKALDEGEGETLGRELIILMGLQASGKSTFYHSHFARTHLLVSKDNLRNNRHPARRQGQLVEEALKAGRSVVVDNTNPTVDDRTDLITIGRRFDTHIVGYYFASEVQACLARNRSRTGKARVPDVAIYTTIKKLVPPSYAEGFNTLFFVHLVDDRTFVVNEWRSEETET